MVREEPFDSTTAPPSTPTDFTPGATTAGGSVGAGCPLSPPHAPVSRSTAAREPFALPHMSAFIFVSSTPGDDREPRSH
jgi:hypothetical protein